MFVIIGVREPRATAARLPTATGPIGALVLELLSQPASSVELLDLRADVDLLSRDVVDPLADDDLQLALYTCYELHYRSFDGVDPAWEWSPSLLGARVAMEHAFFTALEAAIPSGERVEPRQVGDRLFRLERESEGVSLSRQIEAGADLERFREFVVHRSLYQLKEADPHSWAIPRLAGPAKTALLEIQGDEYGGGRPERMHSALFAKTMRALDLDDRENAYLDHIPGVTLATVNLMSGLGLNRSRRGAIAGHLAMFEMTSSRPNRRYANALRRLGFEGDAVDFYDEHVEADAVHENIAAYDLAGGLARGEPELAGDVLFGASALLHLEDRFARHLLAAWDEDRTSLRQPL